jgi:hypothetical protein
MCVSLEATRSIDLDRLAAAHLPPARMQSRPQAPHTIAKCKQIGLGGFGLGRKGGGGACAFHPNKWRKEQSRRLEQKEEKEEEAKATTFRRRDEKKRPAGPQIALLSTRPAHKRVKTPQGFHNCVWAKIGVGRNADISGRN